MNTEIIQSLELFNEKATKLSKLSFLQKMLLSGLEITFDNSSDNKNIEINKWGPDDESLDAFVLTYRFFINDKDGISFRKISDSYSSLSTEFAEYSERFFQIRNEVNSLLDSPTGVKFNNHNITNREGQNIFLFGHLSHSNRNDLDTKRYNRIIKYPVAYNILWNCFIVTVTKMFDKILLTKELNKEVLSKR